MAIALPGMPGKAVAAAAADQGARLESLAAARRRSSDFLSASWLIWSCTCAEALQQQSGCMPVLTSPAIRPTQVSSDDVDKGPLHLKLVAAAPLGLALLWL